MTSKEKIKDILDWMQSVTDAEDVDWGFMQCLKQDLEYLVAIAQTEGVIEVRDALNIVLNKE